MATIWQRHRDRGGVGKEDQRCHRGGLVGGCTFATAEVFPHQAQANLAQPARTLKGVVDAASWDLSQPAWVDVDVLPSGSLQSESSMKKVASGTT
jgi:hypothetical protein